MLGKKGGIQRERVVREREDARDKMQRSKMEMKSERMGMIPKRMGSEARSRRYKSEKPGRKEGEDIRKQ